MEFEPSELFRYVPFFHVKNHSYDLWCNRAHTYNFVCLLVGLNVSLDVLGIWEFGALGILTVYDRGGARDVDPCDGETRYG